MNAIDPKRSARRGSHLLRAGRFLPTGGRIFARPIARAFGPLGHRVLDRIDRGLVTGRLEAWLPDGSMRILGGHAAGPECIVHLKDWRALVRLALSGSVGWFRAWDAGEWSSPDPVPLFALFMANARTLGGTARARGPMRWVARALHALRANSKARSRRNIMFHYDLGNDFYALWLDAGMNYSSALFSDEDMTLEQGQVAKIDAALDRLELVDGQKLLEIGCGWGALAQRAVERANIAYDGITLSLEQLDYATVRLAGYDQARFHLTDYRDTTATYDAIASIEMVEAVGQEYWPDYCAAIRRLLKPGGRAVVQYIAIDDAIFDRYAASADFIQTYIFPGGMLISESRFRAIAQSAGLQWGEAQHFGQDYARTLALWRDRFDAAVEAGHLPVTFDAAFVRLWRYYLMYCEGGFRGGGITVAQVTLTRSA